MYRNITNKTFEKGLFSLTFYFLLSWSMAVSGFAQGQQNAVDGTLQMIPPYPIYLANYAKPTNDKVKLTLTLNPAFWENGNTTVKLRLMLEKGNSLMAQSLDIDALTGVKSVVLVPGVPYTLTPDEILTYFRLPTLQGIDEATYSRALTEGVYRLTVLVYATQGKLKDISKGQPISGAISQQFWIVDNEPPLLNVPHSGDNVKNKLAQSINFQWIPRAIQAVSNTTYEFKITEIAAENAGNPYPEFINKPALKTFTVTNTPYVSYTPNQLGLIAGKTYAWRVRAKSSDFFGTEIVSYKNDGYSDIFTFRYSGTCDKPLGLKLEAKTSDLVATSWTRNPAHLSYRVAYRKYQPGQNWQWFEKETNTNYLNLTELQPNTEYEVTVGGLCAENFLSYSDTLRVKTLDIGQIKDVICGVLPPTDIANKNPLATLAIGDVITAGDFAVNITRIAGGGGNFTGEGFIGVPWIGPKLKVKFNGITVNSDKKLINGFIETAYDPTFSNVLSVDRLFNSNFILDLSVDAVIGTITIGNAPNQSGSSQGGSGTTTNGTSGQPQQVIIITDETGKVVQTLPLGSNYSIIDKNGNQYTISKDGKVTKLPPKVAMPISNSNGKKAGLNSDQPIAIDMPVIIFEKADNTKYGFDAKKPKTAGTYEELPCEKCDGKKYSVVWKSVAAGDSDIVKARILINPNNTPADSIFFQTEDGRAVYAQYEGSNVWRMYLLGTMNGEVKSVFAMAKTFKNGQRKTEICGKINVASYDLIKQKIVLVPVKGFGADYDAAQLKTELNKIYKSALIEYDIVKDNSNWQPSVYDPTKIMALDHGLLYSYSQDQRNIIDAYKQDFGSAAPNTLYFFLCNKSTEGVQGHTPLGKEYGFLFMGSNTITTRVVAHEIAHGAPCGLEHTFENESTPKSSTDNLLDYGTGTDLIYAQWKDIHEFNFRFRIGQDETRGQHVEIQDISKIAKFKNKNGTFTFMTPTGEPFTLPGDIKGVTFYANDEAKFGSLISRFYPDGALRGFILADKTEYFAYYSTINVSEFAGYYEKGDKEKSVYVDKLTKAVERADQDFVIVGLPCVQFIKTSFKVKRIPYTANSWRQADQTGRGPYLDKLPSTVNLYANVESEEIAYSNPFGEKATSFLNKNLSCADGFSKYVFKIASIIDKYESVIEQCYPIAELEQRFARCTTCINNRPLNSEFDYQSVVNAFISEIQRFETIGTDVMSKTTANDMRKYLAEVTKFCSAPLNSLTAEQRAYVIEVLSKEPLYDCNGIAFNNCSEKYILDLFLNIPTDQKKLFLDQLVSRKTIEKLFPNGILSGLDKKGMNGKEAAEVANILFEWFQQLAYKKPINRDTPFEEDKIINLFKYTGSIFASSNQYFFPKSSFYVDNEKICFCIPEKLGQPACLNACDDSRTKKAYWYEWVQVYFLEDIEDIGMKKGDVALVPAFYLLWYLKSENDKYVSKSVREGLDVISVISGGGALLNGGLKTTQAMLLAADVFIAITDLVITENRSYLEQTLGAEFVANWDIVVGVYGLGRLSGFAYGKATSLYNIMKNAKNSGKWNEILQSGGISQKTKNALDRLEQILNKILSRAIKDEQYIDDAFSEIQSMQSLRGYSKISVRTILKDELDELVDIKTQNNVSNNSNTAKVETNLTNNSLVQKKYEACAGYDAGTSKITDGIGSPIGEQRIFTTTEAPTSTGTLLPRHNDSEVKILERIAYELGARKGDIEAGKNFAIEGSIKIKSELAPCGSCTNVIKSFSALFPKIKIEIIAQPKVSF